MSMTPSANLREDSGPIFRDTAVARIDFIKPESNCCHQNFSDIDSRTLLHSGYSSGISKMTAVRAQAQTFSKPDEKREGRRWKRRMSVFS